MVGNSIDVHAAKIAKTKEKKEKKNVFLWKGFLCVRRMPMQFRWLCVPLIKNKKIYYCNSNFSSSFNGLFMCDQCNSPFPSKYLQSHVIHPFHSSDRETNQTIDDVMQWNFFSFLLCFYKSKIHCEILIFSFELLVFLFNIFSTLLLNDDKRSMTVYNFDFSLEAILMEKLLFHLYFRVACVCSAWQTDIRSFFFEKFSRDKPTNEVTVALQTAKRNLN